jgi:hypothetical protein
MNSMTDDGPTDADLAAIETEWPSIAADLAALDAEILALTMTERVDELAVRRARRSTRRVLGGVHRIGGAAA